MQVLIGARVVQGLGVGGLTALVQVVIASMVSPRERGRYSGYIGATSPWPPSPARSSAA